MGTSKTPAESTATRALGCFEELALEKGLDDVSMRDVARRLGISLAALQYHYPTKAALVDAVVTSVIDIHEQRLDESVTATDGPDRLSEAIRYAVIANAHDAFGAGLMNMIWARAEHDDAAAAALDRFMGTYLDRVTDLVSGAFPELSAEQTRVASALAVALVEGLEEVRSAAVAAGVGSDELTSMAVAVASSLPTLVGGVDARTP